MANIAINKVRFITDDFYKNIYNTAFLNEWESIKEIEKRDRFIELASIRIKSLSSRPFVDLTDLEKEQADGIQVATARLIDYWMEYGLDLNRISGSVSLGNFSSSQTAPKDPDYIPKNVYDTLQNVGLYSPIGFNLDELDRYDDDREITYGVRFKGLERVKDVEIDKTDAEKDPNHGNKGIRLYSAAKTHKLIKDAKLSPFVIIGSISGTDPIPTNEQMNNAFNSRLLELDDGTILVPSDPDTSKHEYEVSDGEAIKLIKTDQQSVTIADFFNGEWTIDNRGQLTELEIYEINQKISVYDGTTEERVIKAKEGDLRYLKTDGRVASTDELYSKNEIDSKVNDLNTKNDINKANILNKVDKIDYASDQTALKSRINTNEINIADRYTKTEVDASQVLQDTKISENLTKIVALDGRVGDNETNITRNVSDMGSIEERVAEVESALAAIENEWSGNTPLASTVDLSSIQGSLGPFTFKLGDKIDIVVKKGQDKVPGLITVGAHPTIFSKDAHQVEIAVDTTGTATVTSSTSDQLQTWSLIEIIQKESSAEIAPGYTKSESDARYESKANAATTNGAQDVKINSNTTTIAENKTLATAADTLSKANKVKILTNTTTIASNKILATAADTLSKLNESKVALKQNITDNSLPTTSKTIVGSISEIKGLTDTMNTALVGIKNTKLSDGRKLSEADPAIANDDIVIKKTLDAEKGIFYKEYDRTNTSPQVFNSPGVKQELFISNLEYSKYYKITRSAHASFKLKTGGYGDVEVYTTSATIVDIVHNSGDSEIYNKNNILIVNHVEDLIVLKGHRPGTITIEEYTGATDEATIGPNIVYANKARLTFDDGSHKDVYL